jgi:SAM-dependent methyltransferase
VLYERRCRYDPRRGVEAGARDSESALGAGMTADDVWLAGVWTRMIRANLPDPPARVLEVGRGSLGGFVPRLAAAGYEAIGVDLEAPDGPQYRRAPFEVTVVAAPFDAVVACTSLHHVAHLGQVVDKVAAVLSDHGVAVVVEWDWERFDEATARWCFERLSATEPEGWLHHRRDGWAASGMVWDEYRRLWATQEGFTPATGCWATWTVAFTARPSPMGPTSSPTSYRSVRPRSRPPSKPARSAPPASTTWDG